MKRSLEREMSRLHRQRKSTGVMTVVVNLARWRFNQKRPSRLGETIMSTKEAEGPFLRRSRVLVGTATAGHLGARSMATNGKGANHQPSQPSNIRRSGGWG